MTKNLKTLLTELNEAATLIYRPQILHLTHVGDRDTLEQLMCTELPQVCDTLLAQLRDLLRTRHPARKLSEGKIDEMLHTHLGNQSPLEYGVWVYYPWSRRLVHLLDEAEFVELRTNRNQYKITLGEQATLATKRIGVVGLSVGQTVAVTLAMERSCAELRLADFDQLDLSNLNRIRTGLHNLGISKVIATAREIAELDPFLNVVCFTAGITDENCEEFLLAGGRLDVLVEECDGIDAKFRLRYAARRHGIPVVMDTSDRGMIDVERFDLERTRPIFHNLIEELDPVVLRGLTTEEKVPYVLRIIGSETLSTRMRASLLEIDQSISTWPQLASAVAHGGAAAADVVRRICLDQTRVSGRFFIDLETLIPNTVTKPSNYVLVGEQPPILTFARMIQAGKMYRLEHSTVTSCVPPLEVVHMLVAEAILAPSGGNCQPWRWLSDGDVLHLFLDSIRSSSLTDFENCGAMVALGAATENLSFAAHAAGLEFVLQINPLPNFPELAASFCFTKNTIAEPHWRDELHPLLCVRQTNRKLAVRRPMPDVQLSALTAAVRSLPGADVQWLVTDKELAKIGTLTGAGDRLRLLNEAMNREMMNELRWTAAESAATRDGIDITTLELTPTDLAGVQVCRHWPSLALVREWGGGRNLEKMAGKAIAGASAVGLLTMPTAHRVDYFNGGRAVERCWLTATELGLAFHPMTALPYFFARMLRGGGNNGFDVEMQTELRQLRTHYEQLFNLTETNSEVMLFRLSFASESSVRSLRRPVEQVLSFT